jgi:hypothetical protein
MEEVEDPSGVVVLGDQEAAEEGVTSAGLAVGAAISEAEAPQEIGDETPLQS